MGWIDRMVLLSGVQQRGREEGEREGRKGHTNSVLINDPLGFGFCGGHGGGVGGG